MVVTVLTANPIVRKLFCDSQLAKQKEPVLFFKLIKDMNCMFTYKSDSVSDTYLKFMDKYFDEIKSQKAESSRETLTLTRHLDLFINYKYKNDSWFKYCVDGLSYES